MREFCNIGRKPYPMGQHLEHVLDDESTWCFPDDSAESTLPLSQLTCQLSMAESSVLNVVPIARQGEPGPNRAKTKASGYGVRDSRQFLFVSCVEGILDFLSTPYPKCS
jgi:hypothetical protein